MHVATAFLSMFLLAACSAETDSLALRRGSGASAAKTTSGGGETSGRRPSEASTQQPATAAAAPATAPSSPATPPATPATPLRTNVCENPTCTTGNGACGCTAADTSGATVEMDCQDGICTCTTGDQITTQFGDDGCANDGDARTLYSANCGCL
jgi:hypothetical protein